MAIFLPRECTWYAWAMIHTHIRTQLDTCARDILAHAHTRVQRMYIFLANIYLEHWLGDCARVLPVNRPHANGWRRLSHRDTNLYWSSLSTAVGQFTRAPVSVSLCARRHYTHHPVTSKGFERKHVRAMEYIGAAITARSDAGCRCTNHW